MKKDPWTETRGSSRCAPASSPPPPPPPTGRLAHRLALSGCLPPLPPLLADSSLSSLSGWAESAAAKTPSRQTRVWKQQSIPFQPPRPLPSSHNHHNSPHARTHTRIHTHIHDPPPRAMLIGSEARRRTSRTVKTKKKNLTHIWTRLLNQRGFVDTQMDLRK